VTYRTEVRPFSTTVLSYQNIGIANQDLCEIQQGNCVIEPLCQNIDLTVN